MVKDPVDDRAINDVAAEGRIGRDPGVSGQRPRYARLRSRARRLRTSSLNPLVLCRGKRLDLCAGPRFYTEHMSDMTVHQLAKAAGVSADTVRHYVRRGLLSAERDSNNGYRRFFRSSLQRLRFIKTAQRLGFTLNDIQSIFTDAEQGESPCPRVRELIAAHIEESAVRIRELQALQARMRQALRRWEAMPDGTPDGHSVCRLIESLDSTTTQD